MRLEAGTGCLTGSWRGPNSPPRTHKFQFAVGVNGELIVRQVDGFWIIGTSRVK